MVTEFLKIFVLPVASHDLRTIEKHNNAQHRFRHWHWKPMEHQRPWQGMVIGQLLTSYMRNTELDASWLGLAPMMPPAMSWQMMTTLGLLATLTCAVGLGHGTRLTATDYAQDNPSTTNLHHWLAAGIMPRYSTYWWRMIALSIIFHNRIRIDLHLGREFGL